MKLRLMIIIFVLIAISLGSQENEGSFDRIFKGDVPLEHWKSVNALYYSANIPDAPLGIGFVTFSPRSLGVGMDFCFTPSFIGSKDNFISEMTEDNAISAGDLRKDKVLEYSTINVYMNYTYGDRYTFYLGGGHIWEKEYNQYYRTQGNIGDDGKYWLEADNKSKINIMGGYIHRIPLQDSSTLGRDLIILVGFDSVPIGLHLGLGLNLF